MRSSNGSVINSILEFRSARIFLVMAQAVYISGNISYPCFSAMNATVTVYLLESIQEITIACLPGFK